MRFCPVGIFASTGGIVEANSENKVLILVFISDNELLSNWRFPLLRTVTTLPSVTNLDNPLGAAFAALTKIVNPPASRCTNTFGNCRRIHH